MQSQVELLAATPFEADPSYWREVILARLAAGEASVAAAHAAMLHCGARGYVAGAAAQRRLREAYFVAIVTPAIKQLKKMLADMTNETWPIDVRPTSRSASRGQETPKE
jgi:alkylation response protein AidB-like acyl-CoA dehydrogenase